MEFSGSGLLTLTVFFPLIGALILILFIRNVKVIPYFVVAIGMIELLLTGVVFFTYDLEGPRFQIIDKLDGWIPIDSFNIQYFLGVDGLSLPLVLLAGILGLASIFASLGIKHRVREYFVWFFVLQTSVMGVFTALDFIVFFLFWELELVPMFFLISIWGSGRKEYSAMKFVIFTFLGSAFMLVGILAIFFSTNTFDMTELLLLLHTASLVMPAGLIFTLIFVAFAVKLPIWPLHTWLPDAHTDAPTAVSMMLAGVLLKMGGYGLIRISAGMFPGVMADVAWILVILGVINVLYGAFITLRQTDLKRLIAFSSISHMGYVLIGISSVAGVAGTVSPIGLTGASMQMFTHGTITGLLFLVVGLIYQKTKTRYIPDLGGLAKNMPVITVVFLIAGLGSLGMPGTSGFISELLVFIGAFPVWSWATALGAFGIVITAGYILWMIQRTMFGIAKDHLRNISDANYIEMIPLFILTFAVVGVGVYPGVLTDVFAKGIDPIVQSFYDSLQLAQK